MESIKNALGLGTTTSEEPISGQTGNTKVGEPYDAGNIASTNTQHASGLSTGTTSSTGSNIGPVGDARDSSSGTVRAASSSTAGESGIGPIGDARNTSASTTGSATHSSSNTSSSIPGTSNSAVGSSSGFLPNRGNQDIIGDDRGMDRVSKPTSDINTVQREGHSNIPYSENTGLSSGHTSSGAQKSSHSGLDQTSGNYQSHDATDRNTGSQSKHAVDRAALGDDSTSGSAKAVQESTGGQDGQVKHQSTSGASQTRDEGNVNKDAAGTRGDQPPHAGHATGNKDNLEDAKKHASPAVAKILDDADHMVKEGGLKKLGPNESSDPSDNKKHDEEAAHHEGHEGKPGMGSKIKGALHMGGSK